MPLVFKLIGPEVDPIDVMVTKLSDGLAGGWRVIEEERSGAWFVEQDTALPDLYPQPLFRDTHSRGHFADLELAFNMSPTGPGRDATSIPTKTSV